MRRSTQRNYAADRAATWGTVRRRRSSARAKSRRVRFALLALCLAGIALALWLTFDARFYISHAEVQGANRVIPEDIFRASALPQLHTLWVRPSKIEENILQALPMVKSADVSCRLPAKCVIAVEEREPRVLWRETESRHTTRRLWWIDAEGVLFPALGRLPDVWEVRGLLPLTEDEQLEEGARATLVELVTLDVMLSPTMFYEQDKGFMFADGRGRAIVLGQGPGMAERLHVMEALLSDLERRGISPSVVDVRFPEAPYYSLTNDW